MGTPIGHEALCAAEQAVAFAVPFNGGNFVPESEEATLAGPDILRGIVAKLQAMPENSGFTWQQKVSIYGGPLSPELGNVSQPFSDGSELSALVRTKPIPPLDHFEIAASLYVTPPSGTQDQRHICYAIRPGGDRVIRSEDNRYGLILGRVIDIANRVIEAGSDEDEIESFINASITELGVEAAGLDPTIDPQIEQLRATDDVYRNIVSDGVRNDRENRELAVAMGEVNDLPVGKAELSALGKLLLGFEYAPLPVHGSKILLG